jgi:hypothetical protein
LTIGGCGHSCRFDRNPTRLEGLFTMRAVKPPRNSAAIRKRSRPKDCGSRRPERIM